MRFRGILIPSIVFVTLLAAGEPYALGQDVIQHMEVKVFVAVDSTITINEKINVLIHGGDFANGLERDLPTTRRDQQGHVWPLNYKILATSLDGLPVRRMTQHADDHIRVKLGNPNVVLSNSLHTFEITYVAGMQFIKRGGDEGINRNMTGVWSEPLESFVVDVNFAPEIPIEKVKMRGFTDATATDLFCRCTQKLLGHDFHFESEGPLSPGDTLQLEGSIDHWNFKRGLADSLRVWRFQESSIMFLFLLFADVLFLCFVVFILSYGFRRFQKCGNLGSLTERRLALCAATILALSSLASMFILNEPVTGFPGSMVGLVLALAIGGNPHGPTNRFSWLFIAAFVNFAFYYFAIRLGQRFISGRAGGPR